MNNEYRGSGGIQTSAVIVPDKDRELGFCLKEIFVQNQSTSTLYVKYGVGASSTDFHIKILPGSFMSLPGTSQVLTAYSETLEYTRLYK